MNKTGTWGFVKSQRQNFQAQSLSLILLLLTAIIFYIDTFTKSDSAVGVLYVIILLLAAELFSKKYIRWIGAFTIMLTAFSFLYAHNVLADFSALTRFIISVAAQSITILLILRNKAALQASETANLALRSSENRYRTIFQESRVALWERDYSAVREFLMSLKAGGVEDFRDEVRKRPAVLATCKHLIRTVAANRAAQEFLGEAHGSGDTDADLLLVPDDETFTQLMTAMLEEREGYEGKLKLRVKNGETRTVLVSLRFPEDPAAFNRVIVGMMDITDREMTQRALMEAQAALARASRTTTLGVLSASLAHDLNQPLGALMMNGQTCLRWLKRDPPDLDRLERSLERIIRDSQRASAIVQNTRASIMKGATPPESIDLIDLLDETQSLIEHDLAQDSVSIEIHLDPMAHVIYAVRVELQQVLINLFTNAIQAMKQAGSGTRRIIVATRSNGNNECVMTVRDFGPGISPDNLAKLFDPFFTTKPSGMGLGLSICRSMVEARGGRLAATNHPDGGAVMEIILPIGEENAREASSAENA